MSTASVISPEPVLIASLAAISLPSGCCYQYRGRRAGRTRLASNSALGATDIVVEFLAAAT